MADSNLEHFPTSSLQLSSANIDHVNFNPVVAPFPIYAELTAGGEVDKRSDDRQLPKEPRQQSRHSAAERAVTIVAAGSLFSPIIADIIDTPIINRALNADASAPHNDNLLSVDIARGGGGRFVMHRALPPSDEEPTFICEAGNSMPSDWVLYGTERLGPVDPETGEPNWPYTIAERYGVSLQNLCDANDDFNGTPPEELLLGTKINIYGPPAAPSPTTETTAVIIEEDIPGEQADNEQSSTTVSSTTIPSATTIVDTPAVVDEVNDESNTTTPMPDESVTTTSIYVPIQPSDEGALSPIVINVGSVGVAVGSEIISESGGSQSAASGVIDIDPLEIIPSQYSEPVLAQPPTEQGTGNYPVPVSTATGVLFPDYYNDRLLGQQAVGLSGELVADGVTGILPAVTNQTGAVQTTPENGAAITSIGDPIYYSPEDLSTVVEVTSSPQDATGGKLVIDVGNILGVEQQSLTTAEPEMTPVSPGTNGMSLFSLNAPAHVIPLADGSFIVEPVNGNYLTATTATDYPSIELSQAVEAADSGKPIFDSIDETAFMQLVMNRFSLDYLERNGIVPDFDDPVIQQIILELVAIPMKEAALYNSQTGHYDINLYAIGDRKDGPSVVSVGPYQIIFEKGVTSDYSIANSTFDPEGNVDAAIDLYMEYELKGAPNGGLHPWDAFWRDGEVVELAKISDKLEYLAANEIYQKALTQLIFQPPSVQSPGSAAPGMSQETFQYGNLDGFMYQSQADKATVPYGNTTIKRAGCGIVSTSMVFNNLGVNVTIEELAQYSTSHGFQASKDGGTNNGGTDYGFYEAIGNVYGLNVDQFYVRGSPTSDPSNADIQRIKDVISSGGYVIVSVGPAAWGDNQGRGTFSSGDHVLVIRGISPDGSGFMVADPNDAALFSADTVDDAKSTQVYGWEVFKTEVKAIRSVTL